MTHATHHNQLKKKIAPTKVSAVEKEYGVKFNVRQNMNLATYFEQQGLPALAKVLRRTEQHIQHS